MNAMKTMHAKGPRCSRALLQISTLSLYLSSFP